jgi:hypothetical protein
MNRINVTAIAMLLALLVGSPAAFAGVLADNEPGSFLVFPRFDIRGARVTTLRIENNGPVDLGFFSRGQAADVKLNVVCPGVKIFDPFCRAQDQVVWISPRGTAVIDVAGLNPPCNEGYIVAFPRAQGRPISYNHLTGSYKIERGNRVEAENALHVQSIAPTLSPLDGDNDGLEFGAGNGAQDYRAMPTVSYTGFRSIDPANNEGTNLILLTLDTLAGQQNPPAAVAINFWASDETPFSSSWEFTCWDRVQLDDIDPNFLNANLGTTYGSMELFTLPTCPIPGACPPFNAFDATLLGMVQEFGGGFSTARTLLHDDVKKSTVYVPR